MKKILNFYLSVLLVGTSAILSLQACTQEDKQAKEDKEEKATRVLDSESIYQLSGEWHNQHNDTLQLSHLRGKIPVLAMIFTHCGFACPRIVADMKNIEEQVPQDKKDKVVYVLVSFDTERDHPRRLKAFAQEMELDDNWLLLHGNEEEVRALSMVLDVKYKKQPDGDFAHSNSITLLDTKGVIVAQLEGLGADPQAIVTKLSELSSY